MIHEYLRYNYLVNNCYKAHVKKEPLKITIKPRLDGYVKTRESIFPTRF